MFKCGSKLETVIKMGTRKREMSLNMYNTVKEVSNQIGGMQFKVNIEIWGRDKFKLNVCQIINIVVEVFIICNHNLAHETPVIIVCIVHCTQIGILTKLGSSVLNPILVLLFS